MLAIPCDCDERPSLPLLFCASKCSEKDPGGRLKIFGCIFWQRSSSWRRSAHSQRRRRRRQAKEEEMKEEEKEEVSHSSLSKDSCRDRKRLLG